MNKSAKPEEHKLELLKTVTSDMRHRLISELGIDSAEALYVFLLSSKGKAFLLDRCDLGIETVVSIKEECQIILGQELTDQLSKADSQLGPLGLQFQEGSEGECDDTDESENSE